ncbi:proteasome accessory factor PafA2 [Aeromicrobium sp. YIM 150415]|uniref:Proteasome accessory factor PafA2 n=1 Tax=Aeromicrobium piscarium TaxID=2590901 RepID=A0A554SFN4_9ACTN|nr:MULTISPECIES: depupylase/deamidase Dop [Aeromicrobium]MBM9462501.1 proteasome accessory factor PafA2 [Aeromicrobium sp. YIM 150415]TSD65158.1 proteasome accessory factor PafA2 [Aeromicrobium piscarium]
MTVRRIQGSEVEYGIAVQGQPQANPMIAATHVVNAYAAAHGLTRRAQWDYEEESPLRDARGFDLSREAADPSQLTDEDLGLANIILTNGARLYVDHAHPEYSSPEVTTPLDVVRWERAGEHVMRRGAELAAQISGVAPIVLYKNNIDNKGASYGSHENYLMRRDVPFVQIIRHLTPFFASRAIICGSGRVGQQQDGSVHAFQLSQRADYLEEQVGLETTLKRPIINTRDEPHADPKKYRRLHVIVGDANLADVSIFLKHGTTSLVLAMIEDEFLIDEEVELADPVAAVHAISHDPTLRATVELADGRRLTALDLQWFYLEKARAYVDKLGDDDPEPEQTIAVLDRWESVLTRLGRDPFECSREIDWVAKLSLLEQYRERDGLDWDHAKLHLVDLQYHDIRLDKGLFYRLDRAGRIDRLVDDATIEAAVTAPPRDTRAYFRGRCLERFSSSVAAASWDSVIFDLPGHDSLQRVPMMEPLRGTAEHVEALFEQSRDAGELFSAITGG